INSPAAAASSTFSLRDALPMSEIAKLQVVERIGGVGHRSGRRLRLARTIRFPTLRGGDDDDQDRHERGRNTGLTESRAMHLTNSFGGVRRDTKTRRRTLATSRVTCV